MVLFDEQIPHQHRLHQPGSGHHGGGPHHFNMAENDGWSWDDSSWWDDQWAAQVRWDDGGWDAQPEEDHGEEHEQAETAADGEALASERSWSQAQRTTQLIKKDRGFGSQTASSRTGCFICGGKHLAQECSDRNVPQRGGKGGKRVSFFLEEPYYQDYVMHKGKKDELHHGGSCAPS